jgi:Tfp pilus assembly protein PilW
MKTLRLKSHSGFSLTEVVVSSCMMVLIFGAMAYMTFVTGRSTFQVREQAVSQMQAAAAAERITNTLRNAAGFRPYDKDDMATTHTRVMYDIPDTSEPDGYKTGVVAFAAADNLNSSDGTVKIFEDEDDYTGDAATAEADWEFDGVQEFSVVFNSPSWITISASYNCRGFLNTELPADDEDGIIDTRLAGEFLTDVIAKNHNPGESAQYGSTTSTLFQL